MAGTKSRNLKWNLGVCCVAVVLPACAGFADEEPNAAVHQEEVKVRSIDPRRSLVVTEQSVLSRFSFERVMTQLATQSGVPGLTAVSLFQQWWDTQIPANSAHFAGPHCDDQLDALGNPTLNGYPYFCRESAEGAQATCDPFTPNSSCAYIPIGLFNRFDQAPENGAHCGEYRIVYAKQSGVASTSDRNLLIFEAALPNPHPQQGIKGCQQIVDTWADLTAENSISKRADALEAFYFAGKGVIGPVVSVTNFGDNALGAGQVRTNQFSNTTTGWSLREFKLLRTCVAGVCAMRFTPVTNKNNAYGSLFAGGTSFDTFFPTQVAGLAGTSAAALDINVSDVFNTAQSQASGSTAREMKYPDYFAGDGSPLGLAISAQIPAGGTLTPMQIVLRAQALSCAGCHKLSSNVALGGFSWPASLGFTHVTERETEVVAGQTRYRISDALVNVFLPARQEIFEDFLNERPRPSKAPDHPLGGSRTHG